MKHLEQLARDIIGDGKSPNWYFVTDDSAVVMVTTHGRLALSLWRQLAERRPLKECALEDRKVGVLASVEPESEEPNARLRAYDDSHMDRTLRGY